IEADVVEVGEAAKHQAHLRPREISTHFWAALTASSTTKHILSHAEIALKHLEHVWKSAQCADASAILITPAHLDKNDLGLLLGICKKLNITVLGIACNAVLSLQQRIENCTAVYLDLLQNKFVLSELNQNEVGVSLKKTSRVLDYGLKTFTHNCAKSIANQFVSETRFDPLHTATNEQQFYDKLPLWLELLQQQEVIECELSIDNKYYTINLERRQLITANQHLFNEIVNYLNVLFHDQPALAIICSDSCKGVFGFFEFLETLPGCATINLNSNSLTKMALRSANIITTGDEIHFTKNISWQSQSKAKIKFNNGKLSNLANQPTHLLVNGHAHSLHQALYLSVDEFHAEPIITLKRKSESVCGLSTSSTDTKVEIYIKEVIKINQVGIDHPSSVKINDILEIKNCRLTCQFIKVVQHET
ncbi:MAG: hypothetical protein AAF304_01595, partial [Pseudomonadota bacterium]